MKKCPKCGGTLSKNGKHYNKNGTSQRFKCQNCGFRPSVNELEHVTKIPNVLILDVETAPLTVLTFNVWNTNINPDFVLEDWFIFCWSAKWLFHNEMHSDCVTPAEAKKCNDKRIMQSILKLLNQADIVIAHNLDKFDLPKLNTRLIMNGLKPYSSLQTIDTLKIVKRQKYGFKFTYNRLDYIGQLIRNKGKIETDATLWKKCKKGDKKSLEYMSKYCSEDVLLLEEVYVFIRGWIKSHPNLNLYSDSTDVCCNTCLSNDWFENGEYVTQANVYQSYTCKNCGSHRRSRISKLTKKDREKLFISEAH